MQRLTRAESKARTRDRLLEAAEALFVECGYATTSLDQVAEAAGVTKPAIYRHFASKEDLFLALRERRSVLGDVSALQDSSLPYEERLAEVGRAVARMTEGTDPRVLALQLEFRAMSLRRPDARDRLAGEIRVFVEAAAQSERPADDPGLREGVTEAEVLVLGQLLVEGLREYRAYVPEIITEATFATALSLLAQLTPKP